MGYWRSSSSPYDVQANQGGHFTFDTLKARYESTIPLRGKRKAENIRPINRRDRCWERMIKVSDNEYYVSFDCYRFRTNHNRAITFKTEGTMEYMTIHTPKKTWGTNPSLDLNVRAFSSSSVYWFYHFNLPNGFGMANYHSNKYIKYADKYYTIEKGDVVFQRKIGATEWQPLVVHREFKHTIDRKKAKELRALLKPFGEYYNVMSDMVESKWEWGNLIVKAIHDGEHRPTTPEQALELFKPSGEPHDAWLELTEHLKRRTHYYTYNYVDRKHDEGYRKESALRYLEKDLFAIVRPCKEEVVELGKLSNDRYKWWFA